jgi:hypothetical protein
MTILIKNDMTSNKQIEANRENGLKGGVKTEEGKEVSKFNAVKHGIFYTTLSSYEKDYCQNTLTDLIDELKPVGNLEIFLVERIAIQYLRLFRIAKAESDYMEATLHPYSVKVTNRYLDNLTVNSSQYDEVEVTGFKPEVSADAIQELNNTLIRYDTSVENKLYKSLHELQRIQAIRKGEKPPIPTAVDVVVDNTNDR